MIEFTVPGEPVGKGRPRLGKRIVFTPKKTAAYEKEVRAAYIQNYGTKRAFGDVEALAMEITAYFAIPKSVSKARREAMLSGELLPTKKPDADNIIKIIADSLNPVKDKKTGILIFEGAYRDDAQLVFVVLKKLYSENPRVWVSIDLKG